MFKLLLIWRYFLKRRLAWLAVAAVGLIVMLVVVVLSVMAGLLEQTRQRNHGWSGDVILSRPSAVGFPAYEAFLEVLAQEQMVATATPVIRSFGLVEQEAGELIGVRLAEFCAVTRFQESLHFQSNGQQPSFASERPGISERDGCIVGGLYRYSRSVRQLPQLRENWFNPTNGPVQRATVFALNSRGRLTGSLAGERASFVFVDDSDTGLVDVDSMALYVDFDRLQQLCWMDGSDGGEPRCSEIRIKLAEGVALEAGRARVEELWQVFVGQQEETALLADVRVQDWKQFRRAVIAPVEKEHTMMIAVFVLLSLVAVFIIFVIFYMIVTEKVKDLGIVKSVGASAGGVGQIFLGYGLMIGLVGALVGGLLGCLIVHFDNEIADALGISLWDPDVYAIDRIPNQIDPRQVGLIFLFACAASVGGAWVPAWRASRLHIVRALRGV